MCKSGFEIIVFTKLKPEERLKLIKRVLKNKESVTKVCQEAKISRVVFYRWLKRYKESLKQEDSQKISPHVRLQMIERVKLGEGVSRVCSLYKVSRTIFYRWLQRYDEAPEGQKLEALLDRKPKVEKYFNQAPEEYEDAVLSAVRYYPELSSHKLVSVLPHIGERPILGNHGVQNVLRRNDLSTYEKRLAYAQVYHKPTFATRFFGVFEQILSTVGSQKPSLRKFIVRGSFTLALGVFAGVVIYGVSSFAGALSGTATVGSSIGITFSFLALTFGMFFFLYSLKYYFSIAIVLSFSRQVGEAGGESVKGSFFSKLFGGIPSQSGESSHREYYKNAANNPLARSGLIHDLSKVTLQRQPFVSIHLATYNEKRVVERLLTAATSQKYENYEVVIVDDSTDETIELLNKWKDHPRVKIIHRESREGYKGGALSHALEAMNKKTEFVIIFDADFIPYPDTITQFLKYFQSVASGLSPQNIQRTQVGAVQGYQWHVLNKSENWITRGVRSEYAGSYIVERSGVEIYSGLKQISGSVYMIRADVLKNIGWGKSITEDFELTLKVYEQGYKVIFTPYIQAPAEAVSMIKRLIRQRMRWAEGHSFNVKKMFRRLLFNNKLSLQEKFEFIYIVPYYLQALFLIIGSFSWFMAEVVFRVKLPFWTDVWGWSLIFTNVFALPLMNIVGLFLEEAEIKDYLGLSSFIVLSYVVAPFQGYAALKGFLEKEEGPWFRTPKTGRITDIFTPGRFYRYIFGGILGRPAPEPARHATPALAYSPTPSFRDQVAFRSFHNSYLALATSNNSFNDFQVKKAVRLPRAVRSFFILLLILSTTLVYFSYGVPMAFAATQTYYLRTGAPAGTPSAPTASNYMNGTAPAASAGTEMRMQRNNANSGTLNYTWYSDILPSGTDDAILGTGQYQLNIIKNGGLTTKRIIKVGLQLFVSNANGAAQNQLMGNTANFNTSNANYTFTYSFNVGNLTTNYNIPTSNMQRIGLRIFFSTSTNTANDWINIVVNNSTTPALLLMPNFTVPEFPIQAIAIPIYVMMPFLPGLVKKISKRGRRKKNIWDEFSGNWQWFFRGLTGYKEGYVEERV